MSIAWDLSRNAEFRTHLTLPTAWDAVFQQLTRVYYFTPNLFTDVMEHLHSSRYGSLLGPSTSLVGNAGTPKHAQRPERPLTEHHVSHGQRWRFGPHEAVWAP